MMGLRTRLIAVMAAAAVLTSAVIMAPAASADDELAVRNGIADRGQRRDGQGRIRSS